jgi:hypothetical protein
MAVTWVIRYLHDHGLIDHADVWQGRLSADDVSVSHTGVLVCVNGSARWFVKRADPIRSRGRDLGSEPFVYRLAAVDSRLASVVPACRLIDDARGIIVMDAAPGAPPAGDVAWRDDAHAAGVRRESGAALARVHRIRPARFGEPPWLVIALEPRWGRYAWLPAPCASLLQRLRASPTFRAGFARVRRDWTPSALVHGDIRSSNLIAGGAPARPAVRIVDWELACLGDPAWDLGSLVGDYVATTALEYDGDAPQDPLRPAIDALDGYLQERADAAGPASRAADAEWRWLLERSVRLAAVRIVQTLVEQAQVYPDALPRSEPALIPIAAAMLDRAPVIATALAASVDEGRRHGVA